MKGYEYINDTRGKTVAVSLDTGEVLNAHQITVPEGTIWYTPEQQTAYKQRKENERLRAEKERRKALRRKNTPELGNYFFTSQVEGFEGLSGETVARLIYLNTYIDYENKLMLTQKTPMKKTDLQNVLKISRATAYRFWNEVAPIYISEDKRGYLIVNTDVFFKGKINGYPPKMMCFIQGIKSLYCATHKNNHKYLGYIFKMLPYINTEFNILCSNPDETDINLIQPITIKQFCKVVGYDVERIYKLKAIYSKMTFEVNKEDNTTKESFCAFVDNGIQHNNAMIVVNPHIFYRGSDYNLVKILGKFI